MEKDSYEKIISELVSKFCPIGGEERLGFADLFLKLAATNPMLAADVLLRKELVGKIEETIGEIAQQISCSGSNCRALIETAFNFYGLESKTIGISQLEKDITLRWITDVLKKWEKINTGKRTIELVIKNVLDDMEKVSKKNTMLSLMAKNIENKIRIENLVESFLIAAKSEIEENIYYKMVDEKICKFGNDSAVGLRFLRHLGFFQSTTNPSIITYAYEEFPELLKDFSEIASINQEWRKNPEKYSDELAIFATIFSILPNILTLRPIALLSDFNDGLATYQLNPFLNEDIKSSINDAKTIFSIIRDVVYFYDIWLGWDSKKYNGRPNLVFKVASSSPKAKETIKQLNEAGLGTMSTVTFGFSQEISLIFSEIEGMIEAKKKNIFLTKSYMATIVGRTEDYLREVEIEKIIKGMKDDVFWEFSREIFQEQSIKRDRKEIIKIISSKKYISSLTDERLIRFVGQNESEFLIQKENDIQQTGILVARRIFNVFFGERLKIAQWLEKKFNLPFEDVSFILDKINLLPASKRRAEDSYSLLGASNLTSVETLEQQSKVYLKSKTDGFLMDEFKDSIKKQANSELLKRLLEVEEFQKIYEASLSLGDRLREIGIEGNFGNKGMEDGEWEEYGAIEKTMEEFKEAYSKLKNMVAKALAD